jgi:choice-of-anchor B domain-containing protein
MIDIRNPKSPAFAGCFSEDGYTHDTQSVVYSGPDERFTDCEICFSSNEDTLTIVDVTDKAAPTMLSRTPYEGSAYTHQGWLTEDQRHFLLNDELDEQQSGVPTSTYIFDVADLRAPKLIGVYRAAVAAIDHNLYTKGDRVYEANYRSGLRVLDSTRVAEGELEEVAFFDVYPEDDEAEFNGAWSVYPYFESGIVIVSGIEQGLFVLRPD